MKEFSITVPRPSFFWKNSVSIIGERLALFRQPL